MHNIQISIFVDLCLTLLIDSDAMTLFKNSVSSTRLSVVPLASLRLLTTVVTCDLPTLSNVAPAYPVLYINNALVTYRGAGSPTRAFLHSFHPGDFNLEANSRSQVASPPHSLA